jgi:sporulation protein YlmC with PRC-barrel domain
MKRATDLLGKPVKGKDAATLGKLHDVALELSTGKILLALVSAKSEASVTPVPSASFILSPGRESWTKIDKKAFPKAPQLTKANWVQSLEASRLAEVFQFFGLALEGAEAKPGQMSPATSLIGARLAGKTAAHLGVVEDLMVDLPGRRIVFLVIKAANSPNVSYMYLVPPQSVRADTNGNSLVLEVSPDDFVKGPHFDKEFWVESSNAELAASAYERYAPAEGGGTKPADGGQAEAGTSAQGATPANSASERQLKQAILSEILQDPAVNLSSKDTVMVTTVNGRLTLTGKVKNPKQRQAIGAAADRAAGAGKVDNQLETWSAK